MKTYTTHSVQGTGTDFVPLNSRAHIAVLGFCKTAVSFNRVWIYSKKNNLQKCCDKFAKSLYKIANELGFPAVVESFDYLCQVRHNDQSLLKKVGLKRRVPDLVILSAPEIFLEGCRD